MFGFDFKSKVIAVLRSNFDYVPGGEHMPVLGRVCASAKSHGANEYDAAIMFMFVQMSSLWGRGGQCKEFVDHHSRMALLTARLATSHCSDIVVQLNEIRSKHGLGALSDQKAANECLS